MSCGSCGVEIAPGSATCPNCGAVVGPAAAAPQAGHPGYPPGPAGPYPGYPAGPGGPYQSYRGYPAGPGGPYPGYLPTGPMPARSYNLDGLASALTVMLGITAVTSLIGTLFTPILIVMFLLLAAILVVFLIWFYRARQNAGQMDWQQRWSPPWAIFGWFVPVCFLWFPYQIMADIWRAGRPSPERAKFPFLLASWWACWCLAWFTGYRSNSYSSYTFAGQGNSTVTTHGHFYGLFFGGTVPSLVFAAVAAVLLALIVKRVSDGPVGGVGKLSTGVPWQPGAPAPGQG
jgi:hypothetical protein